MEFKLPNPDQLRKLGAEMGMDITADYANQMIEYITPFADGYRMIASLGDELPPIKYPRGGFYRPEGDENKYGAWAVKAHIKGAKSGKLAGKKVAIKDTYCVAGLPLTNGASVLEGYVPEFDATIVTRLLDAGAEIVGKSVCEYFSFSGGAATSVSGPVHNPRAWGHTPGGSSTGSGALVAAGEVDMATGGDQAGSIRIPASLSGVVGIKPTWGLVPYTGIMGMDATIDHAGPLTANVADNALFLEVMAGPDGLDPRQGNAKVDKYTKAIGQPVKGLKVGVVKEGFGQYDSHPDVDAGVRAAIKRLEGLGCEVKEVSIPWHTSDLERHRARRHVPGRDERREHRPQRRGRVSGLACRALGHDPRPRQRIAAYGQGGPAARRLHRPFLSGLFLLQVAEPSPPPAGGLHGSAGRVRPAGDADDARDGLQDPAGGRAAAGDHGP